MGKVGGRLSGLSNEAKRKAKIASELYKAKELTVNEICTRLGIKDNVKFYRYLNIKNGNKAIIMDQLFYVIYNSYYKHGNYKNDIPPLTVGGIFTIMWLTLAMTIFTLFFNHTFSLPQDQRIIAAKALSVEENKPIFYLIFFGCAVLTYLLFYLNKRYQKIYLKYKDSVPLNTKLAKYLAFSISVLVILSPFLTAMLKNKMYTGRWY